MAGILQVQNVAHFIELPNKYQQFDCHLRKVKFWEEGRAPEVRSSGVSIYEIRQGHHGNNKSGHAARFCRGRINFISPIKSFLCFQNTEVRCRHPNLQIISGVIFYNSSNSSRFRGTQNYPLNSELPNRCSLSRLSLVTGRYHFGKFHRQSTASRNISLYVNISIKYLRFGAL